VQRAKYRFYGSWGIDLFDRTVFLWGHGASFNPGLAGVVARIRQPLEDRLRHRMRLSAYRLSHRHLQLYLQRIAGFRPTAIYGYSNAVNLLAQEALAVGFRCDSLKSVILTSEPVTPKIVATVEKAFQVPAISEYGSLECGFMAGEWNDRTLRVREDMVILETVAREEGGYDIVVTVLANPSFPLVRYAIGDVTCAPLKTPSAGFAILDGIDGRNNDLLISRNGQILHPMIVEEFFEHTPWVRRYRVAQKTDGSLTVMVEARRSHPTDTARLSQELSSLLGGYPVAVKAVAEIPALASGKHRWIMSEQQRDPGIG
jgi:phenylacetate-coenzyme A ligase PaaK-like adenylate-forming protein